MVWKSLESNSLQIYVSFFLSLRSFRYKEVQYLESFFIQLMFMACLWYYIAKAYRAINKHSETRKKHLVYDKYSPLIGDLIYDPHIQEKDVYLRRTKQDLFLGDKQFFIRNYHLIY